MDVIKTRKSTRSYKNENVDEEKVKQILEAARIAPSWANKQCWNYVIVTDKEKIQKIIQEHKFKNGQDFQNTYLKHLVKVS